MWVLLVAKACKTRELQTNVFFSILNNCSTVKVNFVELGFNKRKTNYLPPNILNRFQNSKNLGCFQICLENSAALTEVVVFGREAEAH